MASINIIVDSNDIKATRAATYLAESIRTTGTAVSVLRLAEVGEGHPVSLGVGESETTQVISLTSDFRAGKGTRVVYWLGPESFGMSAQIDSVFSRFKQTFGDLMTISGVRGSRVFVDNLALRDRLVTYVRDVGVLPYPPTYIPKILPGRFSPILAIEVADGAESNGASMLELLAQIDTSNLTEIALLAANIDLANDIASSAHGLGTKLRCVSELDELAEAVGQGLAYVGVGLDQSLSFERIALAATLMRPAIFYKSTVDTRYFADQVTGFMVTDSLDLVKILRLLAQEAISALEIGECLSLHFMKRYGPEGVLMEALK